METYNQRVRKELKKWKKKMQKKPSVIDQATKNTQDKLNAMLPAKYHELMTSAIKNMTKVVLFGSKYTTQPPYKNLSLIEKDDLLNEKTKLYSKIALVEGAGTGAGGLLLGLADFPLLLSIKIKFLYEAAAIYGFDTHNYQERLYILHIFQLAFSSKDKRNEVFSQMENWDQYVLTLPHQLDAFDWPSFQQEYRDYIDLAKLLQLVPVIGAVVGAVVNTRLINKLSLTAMRAYHLRLLDE